YARSPRQRSKHRTLFGSGHGGGEQWWQYEWSDAPPSLLEDPPGWSLFDPGSHALVDGSEGPLFAVGFGTELSIANLLSEDAIGHLQHQGFRVLRKGDTAFRNNKEYVWKTASADELLSGPPSLHL